MSGGSLNYFYGQLLDHIGDFGDRELDELVEDLANLFHDREWYLSCDTGIGDWRESRDKFKKKWFTELGRKDRIDKYLNDAVQDIKDSLGLSENYCENCVHWVESANSRRGMCSYRNSKKDRKERCGEWSGG